VVIGIDVAAARRNCVALDEHGSFAGGRIYAATELNADVEWAAGANVIAIDAPAKLSTAPHGSDDELSPKFRTARCAEIASVANIASGSRGQVRSAPRCGMDRIWPGGLFSACDERAHRSDRGLPVRRLPRPDRSLAAIIALQRQNRSALRVTCGHDDSAIWLPRAET
jgi:hypothetical protein